jgi:hypothetical protein
MVPYMPISSISHNNGVVTNLENEPIYEYEFFPMMMKVVWVV